MVYANVIASGNSAVITLPKRYRELNGIKVGDKVSIAFPTSTMMTIEPVTKRSDDRQAMLEELRLIAKENAVAGFPQTTDEVRDMLGSRHE